VRTNERLRMSKVKSLYSVAKAYKESLFAKE